LELKEDNMGRGRSKAKQTKVARDLKYSNQDMDLENLAKELHGEVKKEKSYDADNSNNKDSNN
jgi:hypothetical protein